MTIVASSSDHLVTWTDERLAPGTEVEFRPGYSAVLRAMTSPTVELVVLEEPAERPGAVLAQRSTRTTSRRSGTGRLGTLRGWPSNCPPSTAPSPRDCASPRARRRSTTDRCWWSRSHGARSAACGPDGGVEVVAECGGGPNGSAIGPDGKVWITNNGGCFEWIDLGTVLVPGGVPATWTGGSHPDVSTWTPARSRPSTPTATVVRCGPPTTWSSTSTAGSGSPTTASASSAAPT